MAKGIIVLDMPESCENCVFSGTHGAPLNDHYFCRILTMGVMPKGKKPDWCPVHPLPDKLESDSRNAHEDFDYVCGWNGCLNKIEGKM